MTVLPWWREKVNLPHHRVGRWWSRRCSGLPDWVTREGPSCWFRIMREYVTSPRKPCAPHILSQYWQPLGLKVKYHWASFREKGRVRPVSSPNKSEFQVGKAVWGWNLGDHYFAKAWLLRHHTFQNALEGLSRPLEIKGWLNQGAGQPEEGVYQNCYFKY